MDNEADRRQYFSEEELQYIKQLPIRKVRTGGIICSARFDAENRVIYLLDDRGIPTGDVRVLDAAATDRIGHKPSIQVNSPESCTEEKPRKKKQRERRAPLFCRSGKKKEPDILGAEDVPDETPCADEDETAGGSPGMVKTKVLTAIIIAAGCVLIAAVLAIVLSRTGAFRGSNTPENEGELAKNQRFDVIQMTQDVLPGQQLTEQILAKVSIDGETYNQSAMSGNTYYSWDKAADLIGLYASEYIPAGQCLAFHQVTGSYVPDTNPFLVLKDGYAYLDIPVNLSYEYVDRVLIGRYLDLTLEIQTQSNRKEDIDTPNVPGLDHSSSITAQTVTDIYRLKDVVILDMITSNGASLFDTMSSYNKIPDGSLRTALEKQVQTMLKANPDKNAAQALSEFYVVTLRIQLPAEQVKAIGKLNEANTQTKISGISDVYLEDTAARQAFVREMRFTAEVLGSVLRDMVG